MEWYNNPEEWKKKKKDRLALSAENLKIIKPIPSFTDNSTKAKYGDKKFL